MIRASFKWMFLIIGTTIGAGYASGREIWQFFGHDSGLAIILFMIFFSVSCIVIMSISYRLESSDYLPVLRNLIGTKLAGVYDVLIFIYLYSITVVMIAGSGATGLAFEFSYWWGVGVIVLALGLLFMGGINGMISFNQYIIPLLISGLLYVLLVFSMDEGLTFHSYLEGQSNWLAAFPFTALNILPLIAVLGAVGNKIKTKHEIWIACIGSGFILGLITFIYNSSLIQIEDDILVYEIPLFAILNNYPFKMVVFMSLLLWLAIFTTAASGILGITTRLQAKLNKPLWLLAVIILITMIPLTHFGFSTLVHYLYPIYGVLNIYVLIKLLFYPLWNKVEQIKQ